MATCYTEQLGAHGQGPRGGKLAKIAVALERRSNYYVDHPGHSPPISPQGGGHGPQHHGPQVTLVKTAWATGVGHFVQLNTLQ